MAFQAELRMGEPQTVNHTPGGAIAAGDVVVVGDSVRIARRDIAANALGALDAQGGVYRVAGDAAIASGKVVYWNDAANKVTETASTHKVFGETVSACTGDGVLFDVLHLPARA